MTPSKKRPASFGKIDLGYDPQGSGMEQDPYFAEVAPGVANSGNLAHKWGAEGDHTYCEAPPTGLKGD
jgi:hypothetical protein